MGVYHFKLPDVGEGTAEAEIVAWHVKIGDAVKEDQPLVDMMTDKATVELTSPVGGTIRSLGGEAGTKAAVGSILVTIDPDGDVTSPALMPPREESFARASQATSVFSQSMNATISAGAAEARAAQPAAAPAVRRRAQELGIDLRLVTGTGAANRITIDDLERHRARMEPVQVARTPSGSTPPEAQEIPLIGLRLQIAERMQLSKRHIPHFSYVEEVDMSELDKLRAHVNAGSSSGRPKVTFLPFFMLALARGLRGFPQINAHYDDEAGVVRRHGGVHIGMATSTETGLMVPVVRHVEARELLDLAREVARLSDAARDGTVLREELVGSTITITSLGALGGVVATPIINRPEVAIICPNRIVERPVVRQNQIVIRKMMNLSSSFDHRVVDGSEAAAFIQHLKMLLENPATIFKV